MMNTYNLAKSIVDQKQEPIENMQTTALQLARFLASDSGEIALDPTKLWAWSITLVNEGTLTCDDSDLEQLQQAIRKTKTLPVFIKAQILALLKPAE